MVRKGKRLRDAELSLDFRFGFFEPGATDEGDGGSEIELDVDLGGGAVSVRMTRNVDPVTFGTVAGRNALDLTADEAADDVDLLLGSRDFLSLEGAGSGDELLGSDDPPFSSLRSRAAASRGLGAKVISRPLRRWRDRVGR